MNNFKEEIEAVKQLNSEIWNLLSTEYISMEFRCDGNACSIFFLGFMVWNSNDDIREWVDDETQEPLINFLRRKIRQEVKKLTVLFFI